MVNKSDRARIFMPFDALKGYKEAIQEKRRVVVAIEGMVSKIKLEERVLMIVKTKINFDDIINIIGVKEDY